MNRLTLLLNAKIQESITEFESFVKSIFSNKEYIFYTDPFKLNLIGVRGSDDHSNLFDDTLLVLWYDDKGGLFVYVYDITTHPGLYYTLNPIPGTEGAGILVEGQYVNGFILGSHTSHVNGVADTYPCLTQAIELPVYRDNVRDGKLYFDPATIQKGMFGIQIHRALKDAITTAVYNWSAACQVHEDGTLYEKEYWPLVEKHLSLYPRVTYTLLKEEDFQLTT